MPIHVLESDPNDVPPSPGKHPVAPLVPLNRAGSCVVTVPVDLQADLQFLVRKVKTRQQDAVFPHLDLSLQVDARCLQTQVRFPLRLRLGCGIEILEHLVQQCQPGPPAQSLRCAEDMLRRETPSPDDVSEHPMQGLGVEYLGQIDHGAVEGHCRLPVYEAARWHMAGPANNQARSAAGELRVRNRQQLESSKIRLSMPCRCAAVRWLNRAAGPR